MGNEETKKTKETKGVNVTKGKQAEPTGIDSVLDKLDAIMEKRMSGLAKSILKSNGIEDDAEMEQIVAAYKNRADTAKVAAEAKIKDLEGKNIALINERNETRVKEEARAIAKELKIRDGYISHVLKLADTKEVITESGVDKEALKKAMEGVVAECDAFIVKEEEGKGGFQIGGTKQGEQDKNTGSQKIRAALGLSNETEKE